MREYDYGDILYRCKAPDDEFYKILRDCFGVAYVCDLRGESGIGFGNALERRHVHQADKVCDSLGVDLYNCRLPINDGQGIVDRLDEFNEWVNSLPAGSISINCTEGRNRTGLVAGLERVEIEFAGKTGQEYVDCVLDIFNDMINHNPSFEYDEWPALCDAFECETEVTIPQCHPEAAPTPMPTPTPEPMPMPTMSPTPTPSPTPEPIPMPAMSPTPTPTPTPDLFLMP